MTSSIDHARCSELLAAFVRGELEPDQRDQVSRHLESCEQCRAEKQALDTLAEGPGEPLSARERAALQQGVMAAISRSDAAGATEPIRFPRRDRRASLARVLGAAAAVTVFGALLYLSATSGGDSGDTTGATFAETQGNEGGGGDAQEPEAVAAQDKATKDGERTNAASLGAASDAAETSTEAGGEAAPNPVFRVAQEPLTGADLEQLGRSGLENIRFAHYYDAGDAGGAETLVEELADAAQATLGSEEAGQVEECAAQVLESDDPALPTLGMIANYEDDDVLILSFVWTTASTGPLDRYMVWAWERDSCDVTVDYVEGRLETSP